MKELNQDSSEAITKTRQALYRVLGEVDPVKINRALREALEHLDMALWNVNEINLICKIDAVRGPYNRDEQDEVP